MDRHFQRQVVLFYNFPALAPNHSEDRRVLLLGCRHFFCYVLALLGRWGTVDHLPVRGHCFL
jgi:hypothetical protein